MVNKPKTRPKTSGISISRRDAETVFAEALKLAQAHDVTLPQEWLDRTKNVGDASSTTFTPMLGTALLAKATDRRVDALSLRASESHKSYSARSLAKEVLVPRCRWAGIDIRTTGAEPLNNQPFLRAKRVGRDLEVHDAAKLELGYLCECLEQADFLENESAVLGLAAFLRARIEVSASRKPVTMAQGLLWISALKLALDAFVEGDSEGGKVGQAVVAAILDLAFPDVRTKRVNDPSRQFPGDVGVFTDGRLVLSAEVKQRPFLPTEILQFADTLAKHDVHRAFIVALRQAPPLDSTALRIRSETLHRVDVAIFTSPSDLLDEALRYADEDLPVSLSLFPQRMLTRLEELEVSTLRRQEWASVFGSMSG